jgi:hypoxanthine phosphoribosyltransferase
MTAKSFSDSLLAQRSVQKGGEAMVDYRLVPCITAAELEIQVARLADQINRDYAGKDLVVVGILKGSFIFLADLIRQITIPVEVDFVRLSSYGSQTETCGQVQMSKDIELPIGGRDVLVVEDIVDTGLSMTCLLEYLKTRQPRSLKVCVLIDKYERRKTPFTADYVGIRLEKGFIVGYGLDFSEKHRNLSAIYEVEFTE